MDQKPLNIEDEVEQLSGLFFSMDEIVIICQLEADQQLYGEAHERGRLKAEAEIRQVIKKQAIAGSSEAQKLMMQFWNESKKQKIKWVVGA